MRVPFSFLSLSIFLLLNSCSNSVQVEKKQLLGNWRVVHTRATPDTDENSMIASVISQEMFDFQAKGLLEVRIYPIHKSTIGTGTWQLTGEQLILDFSYEFPSLGHRASGKRSIHNRREMTVRSFTKKTMIVEEMINNITCTYTFKRELKRK